jgi:cytochrome c biogenesis protein CcdA
MTQTLTIPVLIGAAVVDAINPCEFAVLIILMATILSAGDRKKALFGGLAFTSAIYISYFLMGLGLFCAVQATEISYIFYRIVAVLAILIGLWNIKDFFYYGKGLLMEVPRAWRPRMKKLIRSVTSVPGAFVIGLVVSLFLTPCTSGPYICVLGLLARTSTRIQAIPLLLLYNLIFILPMIIITFLVYFGLARPRALEEARVEKLRLIHLIAGLIMVGLGVGMLWAIFQGML